MRITYSSVMRARISQATYNFLSSTMRRAELSSKKLYADGERSPKANNSNIKRYSQFHILPYKPPKLKVKIIEKKFRVF